MTTQATLQPPRVNLEGLEGPYQRARLLDLSAADWDASADAPAVAARGFEVVADGALSFVPYDSPDGTPVIWTVKAGREYRICIRKITRSGTAGGITIAGGVLLLY